jgi:hypothetical protein
MMTRRQFATASAAATLAAPVLGCGGFPPGPRPEAAGVRGLDDRLARLLGLGALAPSSHNTQPWTVRATGPRAFSLAIDPGRWLPEVDPAGRELVLSAGCFLENVAQGAAAEGQEAEVAPVQAGSGRGELAQVRLVPAPAQPGGSERIRRRRTLRTGHLARPLAPADVARLLEAAGPGAAFFPRGARQAAEGAGFLALTSTDGSAPALLEAGRRFERTALLVRERSIAAQPMSQALEEAPWRDDLASALDLPRPVQFLVRVGYVDRYPEPVSPRRALASFVTT